MHLLLCKLGIHHYTKEFTDKINTLQKCTVCNKRKITVITYEQEHGTFND